MYIWTEVKSSLYSDHTKNGHTVYLSFKNDFTLNLCNKINEFLTRTNCPVEHVLYDILLVCVFFFFFFLALKEGNSK